MTHASPHVKFMYFTCVEYIVFIVWCVLAGLMVWDANDESILLQSSKGWYK